MTKKLRLIGCILASGLSVSGCATIDPEIPFRDVASIVEERTGKAIEWDQTGPYSAEINGHALELLSRPLTASSAVQIALLNNKSLQATYAAIGMSQADVVQAGLLTNPVVDGDVLWPYQPESAAANIVLGVVFNFIELFWRRYKEAVAESALAETKIGVAGAVVDHAAETNRAFVNHVAAKQEVGLLMEVEASARATLQAAAAIRRAGNSTVLDFEQQQNVLTQAKLDLASAQARVASTREALNLAMGLHGPLTSKWSAPSRLPAVGPEPRLINIEAPAVEKSLELAEASQKIITLGYRHQLTNRQVLIPDLGLGVQWERNDGEEEIGPRFDVTVPLFDRGEAKRARSIFEIRQAQDEYWSAGIKVRSTARLVSANLRTAWRSVNYYQKAVLPQQQRLLEATQQQYNAMQEDVFRLVTAKREQVLAKRNAITAAQDYWLANVDLQQLLSGRMPVASRGSIAVASAQPAAAGAGGGH